MDYLILGIILGVVQGISEWLPISSKTQILIVSTFLLGIPFSIAYSFGLFMEIGTIFAAIIYFRKVIWGILKALIGKGTKEDLLLLKALVVITVITGLIGVPIFVAVERLVNSPALGIPMAMLGLVLIADAVVIYFSRRGRPQRELRDITLKDMIIVGIAQGLAALPGVSRSGMTTSSLLLLGVKPDDSFKLSFLSLIPAALGAIAVTILFSKSEVIQALHLIDLGGLITSIAVATLISLLLIDGLLKFAKSKRILTLILTLGLLAVLSGALTAIFG
ncbi:MAG: undecaprenyl-diphosphate phosphatase [Metallosphaera sp.]|uniref:undecaprenyl-diphosphate phosphatase n=1 Tax=Metallosphaera sp. TaxID=2020860 RepID=UPI0031603E91